jgi:endogenous inhibitor of DNA gyrase (YacG/DUF329 family)
MNIWPRCPECGAVEYPGREIEHRPSCTGGER